MTLKVPLRMQVQHNFSSKVHNGVGGIDDDTLAAGDPAALAATIVDGFGLAKLEAGQSDQPDFEAAEGRTRLVFKVTGNAEGFENYAKTLGMKGWSVAADDKSLWITSIGGKTEKVLGEQLEKQKAELRAAIKSYNDEIALAKKQLLADVTGSLKRRKDALSSSETTAALLEKMGLKRRT